MMTVKRKVHFQRGDHGRLSVADKPRPSKRVAPGRIPRISRLMALAIRFDRMIREGQVNDISELARLAHVSQPRMTQIMNLNHLAPDIQEALLFLSPVNKGRERVHELMMRRVAREAEWGRQRATAKFRLGLRLVAHIG